eukprot:TRINITY_DN8064_c0_g2_i1.p1 TRINITY_DN8064_c0_g2~~TRINITY_DN8064_c0_g2_i1.p1  ORF type:complete len:710 (+),score=191.92 TRINITY_DN8064_c0_g2_i1:161-2131(+)
MDERASLGYEVGWLDESKKITDNSIEKAETLVRKKPIVTQDVVRSFIRDSTWCSAPWVIKDTLAQKYGISTDIPEELKEKVLKLEKRTGPSLNSGNKKDSKLDNGVMPGKKRKVKEIEEPAENLKGKKKKANENDNKEGDEKPNTANGKSKGTKSKIKEGEEKPKVEPIKYPIEDTLLQPGPDDPVFTQRPSPSTDFAVPMDCVGDLLMVWDFCTSFSKALHLWPFSLEDFEKAISYKDGDTSLLSETHYALLRIVSEDSVAYQELMHKKRKPKVSVHNWKDHLSDFIESEKLEKSMCHAEVIKTGGYRFLEAKAKLEILHELVERTLDSDVVRRQLEEYIEERQALAASKREVQLEESRRKKEEIQQLKQSNAASKDNGDASFLKEDGNKPREDGFNTKEGNTIKQNGCKHLDGDSDNDGNGTFIKPNNSRDSREFIRDHDLVLDGAKNLEDYHGNGNGKYLNTSAARKSAMKQKLDAKAAEEKAKESARIEEQKRMQEKRKAKAEQLKEQKLKEQREIEVQKVQERFEREIEKRFIRTNSLGRDRDYCRYWFFRRDGRLFVENKESDHWSYYSAKEELEALIGSLNPKGERECALKRQLEKHQATISAAMQRRTKELAHKFALEEASLRRSSRVRTQSKIIPTGFLAYTNKYRG